MEVDLRRQTIEGPGFAVDFDIEPERKRLLLEGLDDIGSTLAHADAIREFEQRHRARMPWVFARDAP